MKCLFFPCHMCGSFESEKLYPSILPNGSFCKFQEIVICKKCGLIYKVPVIPELNALSYSKKSWGDGRVFKERVLHMFSWFKNFSNILPPPP